MKISIQYTRKNVKKKPTVNQIVYINKKNNHFVSKLNGILKKGMYIALIHNCFEPGNQPFAKLKSLTLILEPTWMSVIRLVFQVCLMKLEGIPPTLVCVSP